MRVNVTRTTLTRMQLLIALVAGLALPGMNVVMAAGGEGHLGVTLARINIAEGDQDQNGVYIVGIGEESGAAMAGLQRNDRIIKIDRLTVVDLDDVHAALEESGPGDQVTVTIQRDGEAQSYSVGLGKQKAKGASKAKGVSKTKSVSKDLQKLAMSLEYNNTRQAFVLETRTASLGVETQTLGPQLASFFGVDGGVLVAEVTEGGPVWQIGLQAGDVIVGWNGSPVVTEKELDGYLAEAEAGDMVDLEVQRQDHLETFVVTLGEAKVWELESLSFSFEVSEDGPKLRMETP